MEVNIRGHEMDKRMLWKNGFDGGAAAEAGGEDGAGGSEARGGEAIRDFLSRHASGNPVSFHMPGHKGSAIYRQYGFDDFLDNMADWDITELPGADNLFQAEGIIDSLQRRYAALYGVAASRLLVNGSSGGLIAALLSSVREGGKVIMARNSHKSVFNALRLGNIQPVYANPRVLAEYGISGPVAADDIEWLLDNNPDADAVILPSPNYYGICSDIEAAAEAAHSRGKILITDQAHGAHLRLFSRHGAHGLPKSAEESGADIAVNSTHKTLASFTQSAVLNCGGSLIDLDALDDRLQCVETTSPSYILMASLDINAAILERAGGELMRRWHENIMYFYNEAASIPGLRLIEPSPGFDCTKLNFSIDGLGGGELEAALRDGYGIFSELCSGRLVMCMTGIGNTRGDFDKLLEGLLGVASKRGEPARLRVGPSPAPPFPPPPGRQVFPVPKSARWMALDEAEGAICALSLVPYPPGVPIVCPGEAMTREDIETVKGLRRNGKNVIGLNASGQAFVGSPEGE
jgi:lysine decarboxylase